MAHRLIILLCSFLVEIAFGYPKGLFQRIRHPVVWIGACISFLEQNFNHRNKPLYLQYLFGILTMVILLALAIGASLALRQLGDVVRVICFSSLLATRSLYDHVYEVYDALTHKNIETARDKVSRIVGRNVHNLDASDVSRAAIESLSESFSDGVVAPLFWAVCFGLPGIACYKAINTADSMIGHKDERYRAFGWAAARIDDIANLIPARISGMLIALAAGSLDALRCMFCYASNHASPNAGWPEAAMAGALNVTLGGTNTYDGIAHSSATIGDGTDAISIVHLEKALDIYVGANTILWLMALLALQLL